MADISWGGRCLSLDSASPCASPSLLLPSLPNQSGLLILGPQASSPGGEPLSRVPGPSLSHTTSTCCAPRSWLIALPSTSVSRDAAMTRYPRAGSALGAVLFAPGPPWPCLDHGSSWQPGRLKKVQGIGWYLEEENIAQVSTNLLDFETTPLHAVYEEVCRDAKVGQGTVLVSTGALQRMSPSSLFSPSQSQALLYRTLGSAKRHETHTGSVPCLSSSTEGFSMSSSGPGKG